MWKTDILISLIALDWGFTWLPSGRTQWQNRLTRLHCFQDLDSVAITIPKKHFTFLYLMLCFG